MAKCKASTGLVVKGLIVFLLSDTVAHSDVSHPLVDFLASRGAFLPSAVLHMCTRSNDSKYWFDTLFLCSCPCSLRHKLLVRHTGLTHHFYHASICEGDLRSRNSVCLSVCLSYARIVTNLNGVLQIYWYHTKGQSLCYSDTNSDWWATLPSLWNLRWK